MELLLELLPDPELGYEGTGTGGAGGGCGSAHVSTGCSPGPAHSYPAHDNPTLSRTPGRRPVRGPCPHLPNPTAPSQLSSSPPHGLGGPWGLQTGAGLGSWEWARGWKPMGRREAQES